MPPLVQGAGLRRPALATLAPVFLGPLLLQAQPPARRRRRPGLPQTRMLDEGIDAHLETARADAVCDPALLERLPASQILPAPAALDLHRTRPPPGCRSRKRTHHGTRVTMANIYPDGVLRVSPHQVGRRGFARRVHSLDRSRDFLCQEVFALMSAFSL
jgi:hypothetical protein